VTESRARLAVFASGGGSNLQAILEHFDALGASAPARVALVLSDRKAAGALDRAKARGIPSLWLPRDRNDEMLALLQEHAVTHIALAGYLRLIPPDVVRAYEGRMVNIHPALLPAFGGPGMYGHHVHEAVVASGARVTGATVHWVTEHYDEGAIIEQVEVPVHPGDTPGDVAARVLEVEHAMYPRVVAALCAGRLSKGASHSPPPS
jgi:phosphoribosylglycinamide formyltransferase-1